LRVCFLLLLGVQGVALHLFPHRLYLRWSSFIQTAAFFVVLTLYFLTPLLANPLALGVPGNRLWYALVPSYWFFGLFQVLTGSTNAALGALARRALAGVAWVTLAAATAYMLAYARQMRRTVEQSGIAPARRAITPRQPRLQDCSPATGRSGPSYASLDAHSRVAASTACCWPSLPAWDWRMCSARWPTCCIIPRQRPTARWNAAAQTALGIPLILLFFLIVGLRVSFSIPMEVRANWLFRLTDPFARAAYLDATRKTLLLLALAPVVAIATPIYLAVWPWPRALGHAAFLAAFGLLIIELALTGFAKVPFTCSYLPGKANLKIMFGVYWGLLIIVSEIVTDIEQRALSNRTKYAWLMGITLLAWLVAACRGRWARARIPALSFEEQPEPAVVGLGLAGRN